MTSLPDLRLDAVLQLDAFFDRLIPHDLPVNDIPIANALIDAIADYAIAKAATQATQNLKA